MPMPSASERDDANPNDDSTDRQRQRRSRLRPPLTRQPRQPRSQRQPKANHNAGRGGLPRNGRRVVPLQFCGNASSVYILVPRPLGPCWQQAANCGRSPAGNVESQPGPIARAPRAIEPACAARALNFNAPRPRCPPSPPCCLPAHAQRLAKHSRRRQLGCGFAFNARSVACADSAARGGCPTPSPRPDPSGALIS